MDKKLTIAQQLDEKIITRPNRLFYGILKIVAHLILNKQYGSKIY